MTTMVTAHQVSPRSRDINCHPGPEKRQAIAAEHAVLAAHAGGELAAIVIRPADVYGPGCGPYVLDPLDAIRAGRFVVPAGGLGWFTVVYIDDLVDGVVAAATSDAGVGQIFHLGGEEPITTGEYFGRLGAMVGRTEGLPSCLTWSARCPGTGGGLDLEVLAKTRPVCNAKAREVLGWWPRVELDEGMARTEAWLRAAGHLPLAVV